MKALKMSEFFRPEARALLWRWRDVLIALVILLLGIWLGIRGFGIVQWLGYALICLSCMLAIAGVQRVRFRRGDDGPGVVQIVERRVGYFGPLTGGAMDLDDLIKLELDPETIPTPHWVLTSAQGTHITIPVAAKGAEALFDAFSALPGMKTNAMLAALETLPDRKIVIWQQRPQLLH